MMIPLNCKLPDKGTVINSSRGGGGRHLGGGRQFYTLRRRDEK